MTKAEIEQLEALMLEVYDPNDESQALIVAAELARVSKENESAQSANLDTCIECEGYGTHNCNSCGGTGYC